MTVKLTMEQAQDIRALYSAGVKPKDLAEQYCVDRTTIHKIIHGNNWLDRNVRYCMICNKPFVARTKRAKLCSRKCIIAHANKRSAEKKKQANPS